MTLVQILAGIAFLGLPEPSAVSPDDPALAAAVLPGPDARPLVLVDDDDDDDGYDDDYDDDDYDDDDGYDDDDDDDDD